MVELICDEELENAKNVAAVAEMSVWVEKTVLGIETMTAEGTTVTFITSDVIHVYCG